MLTVIGKLKIARGTTVQREAVTLEEGQACWDTDLNRLFVGDGSTAGGIPTNVVYIGVACSDETTDLTTGTAKVTFRSPCELQPITVRSSVNTAPTGAALVVDINEAGVSILSTKLSIDAGEKTSTSATTPPVFSDVSIADDAELTIDIDQVGSTVPGKGLKLWLIGYPLS